MYTVWFENCRSIVLSIRDGVVTRCSNPRLRKCAVSGMTKLVPVLRPGCYLHDEEFGTVYTTVDGAEPEFTVTCSLFDPECVLVSGGTYDRT